jgi:hypothetical protein
MPIQRAAILTFKLSDLTTQLISLPANYNLTPRQVVDSIINEGGFWTQANAGTAGGDKTGINVGQIWVNYAQVVSVTIS